MHEFNADRAAIGVFTHTKDFSQRSGFKAEIIVQKNRARIVLLLETVGFGIKFRMVFPFRQPQRIQIRQHMAAHAIRTDQHQGTNGIKGRLPDIARRRRRTTGFLKLFQQRIVGIVLTCRFHQTIGKTAFNRLANHMGRARRPAAAAIVIQEIQIAIFEFVEKRPPTGIDAFCIFQISLIQFGDIGFVALIQRGRVPDVIVQHAHVRHSPNEIQSV